MRGVFGGIDTGQNHKLKKSPASSTKFRFRPGEPEDNNNIKLLCNFIYLVSSHRPLLLLPTSEPKPTSRHPHRSSMRFCSASLRSGTSGECDLITRPPCGSNTMRDTWLRNRHFRKSTRSTGFQSRVLEVQRSGLDRRTGIHDSAPSSAHDG